MTAYRFSKKFFAFFFLFIVSLSLAALAIRYYFSDFQVGKHKPLEVSILEIREPENSAITSDKILPQPLKVLFSSAAANIQMLDKNIETGINMSPSLRGTWRWQNDYTLQFMPEKDWLPNTTYKVILPTEIFNSKIDIKDKRFSFKSPDFSGTVVNQEFYEDPRDVKNKLLTASFKFNYPLQIQNLDKHISIRTTGGKKYGFTYKLSDFDTILHVISDPIKINSEADFAKIEVKGIQNAYSPQKTEGTLTASITIPASNQFFKFVSANSKIVRNAQDDNNPEQVLFLNFSTAVNSQEAIDSVELYYVKGNYSDVWKKLNNENDFLEKHGEKLKITYIPGNQNNSKQHMFKYDVDAQDGWLIVRLQPKLQSVEGFVLGQEVTHICGFQPYPLEAKIAFDGSLLSLKGSRKIAFVSRGVNTLKASIARINSDNLNHLATQTSGDFSHPYFINYNFTADNISEVFEKTLQLNAEHPAKADYSSLDLDSYFENKKGIFIVKVRGYADDEHFSDYDSRLLVLTDLGIVVKDNSDKTHDLFVADISTGKPVDKAKVEVLARNGLPLLSAETNADGYAKIPDFSQYKRDKEAVVYKVSKGEDISFLPLQKNDRRLNMSRFDIGGEFAYESDTDQIKGYVFSDRGIYRPGEDAYFGIIVRQNNMTVPQKLPLIVQVRDANGDIAAQADIWTNKEGFMDYSYKILPTAPTGRYYLEIYTKNKDNQRRFLTETAIKVEEFQPDTLRINAQWASSLPQGWFNIDKLNADVSLLNLYGNPAADHEIQASYHLTPTDFRFKKYDGYVFRDPLRDMQKSSRTYQDSLDTVKTDTDGKARLTLDLQQFEKGTYFLSLDVDGLEAGGGRGVSTSLSALVSPLEYLIGWKADGSLDYINKNAVRKIDFIAVNHLLEAVEPDDLFIVWAEKTYISSLVEMKNGTFSYQMVPQEKILLKKPWKISATGNREDLNTQNAGEFALRIEDGSGQILAKIDYTVTGESNMTHAIDRDASLGLKLNRAKYNNGEKIEMQITAPYAGYGLITIERDSVYAYKWFKADTSSLSESIVLPQDVEGNAYVNVIVFRDIASPEIYMPAISYATIPFSINKDLRSTKIKLDVPETVKPGDTLKINYQTSVKSKIVIYGVNQGILQIADYKLPDPLQKLMPKKALRVVTSQIMDLIMPDIRVLRMLSSSGGDGDLEQKLLEKNLNPFARKADKPVAFWSGILNADKKVRTYEYQVPETFNGEIKIMAVAVSEDRFGSVEKSVLSRGDFALIPSGPLNVSPNDEFVIGLSVGNLVENSGHDYPVQVKLEANKGFEIIGSDTQQILLNEGGEKLLKFRLKTLSDLGSDQIVFTARSLKDESKTARMPYAISIRPASAYKSEFLMGYSRSKYILKDVENLYEEYRIQQLSASSSPLVLTSGMLKYLDKFPHFCTEQAISKIFPSMELFFRSPELVQNIDIYALFDNVTAKLRQRQTLSGGFSMWGISGDTPQPFISVYAAHFLVKAKQNGFNVPDNMLKKALEYCEQQASGTPHNPEDIVPAYAAYVMTLNGTVTTNYLLNLEEYYQKNHAKKWKQSLSASFMAASYRLLQNKAKAQSLYGHYVNGNNTTNNMINAYLAATHFGDDTFFTNPDHLENLLKPLMDGDFTTQSAAWSVLALNAVPHEDDVQNIKFSGFTPTEKPFPTVDFNPQTKDLTVTSDRPFYYMVSQLGFPIFEKMAASSHGLEIEKTYFDQSGQVVTEAKLGDELTVKILLRSLNSEYIRDVAVVDLIPGCFEVMANSLTSSTYLDASEIREDRIIAHVTAQPQSLEISYKVKIIAEGNFVVPPVDGSALYNPLIRANSASGNFSVAE